MCAEKGMAVKVIPLSHHHEIYCAEDIEIWEVRRHGNDNLISDSKNQCIVQTWSTEKTDIAISLDGMELNIMQAPQSGIGGILWPSSIIGTRYVCLDCNIGVDDRNCLQAYC